MVYQKVELFNSSTLEIYLNEDNDETIIKPRPALLIIPGGGYAFISRREAEPVALRFMAEGFNCFVLSYSCLTAYPIPHKQVAVAMDYLNKHSQEFNIQEGKISLIGFSAGGHLVGSYSYLYKEFAKELGVNESSLKPIAIILSYPVISTKEFTHLETSQNITGGDKLLLDLLSVEKHVNKDYPPTFIWTTKTDKCVNPINTKIMIDALAKSNVLHESIIYDNGEHGGSLFTHAVCDNRNPYMYVIDNQSWVNKSAEFLLKLFF